MNINSLVDVFKNFPNSYVFRDIQYFLCGIFLIFISSFFIDLSFLNHSIYFNLSSTEKIFILIAVCYFVSRFCVEIGIQEARFVRFLLRSILKKKVEINWEKIKKILICENQEINRTTVSHYEIDNFVAKNTSLSPSIERNRQNLILKQIFIGYVTILIYLSQYRFYFLIILIFLFMSEIEDQHTCYMASLDALKIMNDERNNK